MRRIQLTNHQLQQPAHLVGRARAFDQRLILSAHGFPVCAVIISVVKEVAQVHQPCRNTSIFSREKSTSISAVTASERLRPSRFTTPMRPFSMKKISLLSGENCAQFLKPEVEVNCFATAGSRDNSSSE